MPVNFKDPTTKLSTLMQVMKFDIDRLAEQESFENAIDMLRQDSTTEPEPQVEAKSLEDRIQMIEYLLQSLLQSQGGNADGIF